MLEFYPIDIERMVKEANSYPPIKKTNDVFKSELTFFSEHIWYSNGYTCDDVSIHKNVPIDVLCKSNSSGERVFFVLDSYYRGENVDFNVDVDLDICNINNIILNIDGKKNIKIEDNYADLDDERFEITTEQLYELCMASSLKLQINGREGVLWECDADGFISILQALYNEAFDNSVFTDANNIIRSDFEEKLKEIKKQEEQSQQSQQSARRKRNLGWFLLFGGIIIGLLAIPFMNSASDVGIVMGILCIVLGVLGFVIGLVFSLVFGNENIIG